MDFDVIKMIRGSVIKLAEILSSAWGWIAALGVSAVNYFAGHSFMVKLVIVAVVLDAAWGIAVSVKRKKFTLSELARNTVGKIAVYGTAIITFIGIDKVLGAESTLTTSVISVVIVLIEFWSSAASMLIFFPNMPFLRLMKKALTGEIARKLGVETSEVEDILSTHGRNGNN